MHIIFILANRHGGWTVRHESTVIEVFATLAAALEWLATSSEFMPQDTQVQIIGTLRDMVRQD